MSAMFRRNGALVESEVWGECRSKPGDLCVDRTR